MIRVYKVDGSRKDFDPTRLKADCPYVSYDMAIEHGILCIYAVGELHEMGQASRLVYSTPNWKDAEYLSEWANV